MKATHIMNILWYWSLTHCFYLGSQYCWYCTRTEALSNMPLAYLPNGEALHVALDSFDNGDNLANLLMESDQSDVVCPSRMATLEATHLERHHAIPQSMLS